AAIWYIVGARHTVVAQVHVASSPPWTVFKESEGKTDFNTYLRTQAGRIKSQYVANTALNRDEVRKLDLFNRDPDPIGWIIDENRVDFKEDSEFLSIAMTGTNVKELTILVNAVAHAYLQEVANAERKRLSERVAKLDGLYTTSREKLR